MTLLLFLSGCVDRHFMCFVAGTLVDTPDGPRPIEDLEVGDLVHAFDVATLTRTVRPITAVHSGTIRVRRIGLADREVTSSLEHPFWSEGAWVEARSLQPGSPVHVWNGRECSERRVVSVEDRGDAQVFNISVQGEETYFANGILVHNKSPEFIDTGREGQDSGSELRYDERLEVDEKLTGLYTQIAIDMSTEAEVCAFSWPVIGVAPVECEPCEYAYTVEFGEGFTGSGDCGDALGLDDGVGIEDSGTWLHQGIGLGWDGYAYRAYVDGEWIVWGIRGR